MQYIVPIILAFLLLLAITRPFTILFHELGHALPLMLMTRKGAEIFVGSYGDRQQCFRISIGKLDIWFRYNPFKWRGGLCIAKTGRLGYVQELIYTSGGTIFSLMITAVLSYLAFAFDWHGFIKLLCIVGISSALIDMFFNLTPHIIKLEDGSVLYSDGYQFRQLLVEKKYYGKYLRAIKVYNDKNYKEASKICQQLIDKGMADQNIYRVGCFACISIKEYDKAMLFKEKLEASRSIAADDYYCFGLLSSGLKQEEEAKRYFARALEIDPNHSATLNAIGYGLIMKKRFEEAIIYFDKAIEHGDVVAFAYNNRGQSKIETGKLEDGLTDIQRSLDMDASNAYAYRNLGIYHLKKGEQEKAKELFLKAKAMDSTTDLIDDYIKLVAAE